MAGPGSSYRIVEPFDAFYVRHGEQVLGYFARRVGDPEVAANANGMIAGPSGPAPGRLEWLDANGGVAGPGRP